MVDAPDITFTVVELISLWIAVSVPVHLIVRKAKGTARFGQSVGATMTGGIFYAMVLVGAIILLGAINGESESVDELGLLGMFAVWLAAFRFSVRLAWKPVIQVSGVSLIVFLLLNALLGVGLGLSLPSLFQFPL